MAKESTNRQAALPSGVLDVNERTWLPRYCRGEQACFVALVNAYKAPVFGYLIRSGFANSHCDDLFQEIFAKVHRAAASYNSHKPLKPWIFTIAVNTVRNFIRDQKKVGPQLESPDNVCDPGPTPERVMANQQSLSLLERAIIELPKIQSEVLQLSSIEGLSHKEISSMLAIPVNTVKTHLRRARKRLIANFLREERSQ